MSKRVNVPLSQRLRDSKAIFGQSIRMLGRERDLWVFPVLATSLMLPLIALPIVLTSVVYGDALGPDRWGALYPLVLFGVMLPVMIPAGWIASLLQSGLAFGVHERVEGRPCSVREAWARAWSQRGVVFRFSLIAALVAGLFQMVGVVLEKLRLVPFLGSIAQTVGMFAWAAATFFVIPIIVVEREQSAAGAIRSSVGVARSQWGKAVGGIVTIALAVMLPLMAIMLILMGLMFPLVFVSDVSPLAFGIAFGITLGLVVFVGGMLAQAAQTVYQTVLYRFARTGQIAEGFSEATLVDVWKPYH